MELIINQLSTGIYKKIAGNNIQVTMSAQLNEGTESFIQFRASDLAGNGPTETTKYYFKIDTTPVTFNDVRPNPKQKQTKERIKCAITIEDIGGSGVNLSTIQYRYTTKDIGNFTDWSDLNLALLGNPADAVESTSWFVELKFKRGGANYVQWRAKDLAGNGYTLSEPYSTYVNAPPVISVNKISAKLMMTSKTDIKFNAEQTYDIDDDLSDLKFTWYSNISGKIGTGIKINKSLIAGHHQITLVVYDGYNNATHNFNITVIKPKASEALEGAFGMGRSFDYAFIFIIIILIILLLFSIIYSRERKRRRLLEYEAERMALGPDASYIPPRSVTMISPTGTDSRLPISAGRNVILDAEALHPSPYGKPVDLQSLPRPGISVNAAANTTGQQLPQLPPAQMGTTAQTQTQPIPEATPEKEIDIDRKIELLEQRMLLGQIPVALYQQLSKKYEMQKRLGQQQPDPSGKVTSASTQTSTSTSAQTRMGAGPGSLSSSQPGFTPSRSISPSSTTTATTSNKYTTAPRPSQPKQTSPTNVKAPFSPIPPKPQQPQPGPPQQPKSILQTQASSTKNISTSAPTVTIKPSETQTGGQMNKQEIHIPTSSPSDPTVTKPTAEDLLKKIKKEEK